MKTALVLLLLAAIAGADELQTKDGKKIEFKNLSDEGDHWELTTPTGTKVSVNKADFYSFIPSGKKEVPLTGAQFTFDKKRKQQTTDMLPKFDPSKDVIGPEVKLQGGVLSCKGGARVQFNFTPPEEYDLTMQVEAKENAVLYVGLVGGGRQFCFGLGAMCAGLEQVNGQCMWDTSIAIQGNFFKTPGAKTVVFMVRREVLIVTVDGKDFFGWKAEWDKLSVRPIYGVPSKNSLFLSNFSPNGSPVSYLIHRMTVSAPKE
jgi:hypothetical protein